MTTDRTEAEIQRQLNAHAERIALAKRENWAMLPIPLEEKEWQLRLDAHLQMVEASNQRIRDHERRRRNARNA